MVGAGAALILVAVSLAGTSGSALLEARAEGSALGLGPAARSEAIRNAQSNMVISRLETLAGSRDFSLFAPILKHAETYVPSFRILEETKTEDATHVEIAGQLLDAKLKNDTAALVLSGFGQKPRVVLLVAERIAPAEPRSLTDQGTAETALTKKLRDAHFEVLDASELLSRHSEEELLQCLAGSPELAGQLARSCLADIAITGSATTLAEQEGTDSASGLKRDKATLTLRVVRAADGFVLDEIETEATLYSVDPHEGGVMAIQDACDKVAAVLMSASALGILAGTPSDKVFMTIEGLGNEGQLQQIVQTIKKCPGVGEIEEMYKSDEMVRLSVAYAGPMGPMVDAISGSQFPDYSVRTHSVVNRDVTLRILQ